MGKRARARMAEMDAVYRAVLGDQIPKAIGTAALAATPGPRRRVHTKPASDVLTTRPNGSTSVDKALGDAELRKVLKERIPISPQLRARVLLRDGGACRYCGTAVGPFEMDHVVPVALGGATTMKNLVTACRECNQRKGARIWRPRPLRRM